MSTAVRAGTNVATIRQRLAEGQTCFVARVQGRISAVQPENKPAFGPLEKTGYRRIGVIGYVKLG